MVPGLVLLALALGGALWWQGAQNARAAEAAAAQAMAAAPHAGAPPAPIVRKGRAVKVKGKSMASWIVSGAGDSTYNGTYTPSGTYGDYPLYTNANGRVLYYGGMYGWILGPATSGTAPPEGWAYEGGDALPANPWGIPEGSEASAPAPTVAEATVEDPDWPWAWWWDAPFFGNVSAFAPCAATLDGTGYLVLAGEDTRAGYDGGFELFNLSTKTFSRVLVSGDLFGSGEYSDWQTGAAYDVGDGEHIDVCSGLWDDAGTPTFTWRRFAVTPGGDASQVSTVDVALPAGAAISRFVKAGASSFRFLVCYDGDVYLASYTAGASSYTLGAGATAPALPTGYSEVACGSGGTGPPDYDLLLLSDTYYWLRHCRNASNQDRIVVCELSSGACSALDDTVLLGSHADYYQTWAWDPQRSYVQGDIGSDDGTLDSVKWRPGEDGLASLTFATAPALRRWYVLGGDERLYVMGWTNGVYSYRPFAIDTTPTPVDVTGLTGQGQSEGTLTLTSTPPVDVPGLTGQAGSTGTLTLRSMTPVEPEVAGTAGGAGTVEVRGAARLEVVGTAGGSGTATLEAPSEEVPDGLGGYGEMVLTPGVWPGVNRKRPLPNYFDRILNRRFGGRLDLEGKPGWRNPLDQDNPLAPYAKYWSWMAQCPWGGEVVANAADPGKPGAAEVMEGLNVLTVTEAPTTPVDYNGEYRLAGIYPGVYVSATGQFLLPDPSGVWVIAEGDPYSTGIVTQSAVMAGGYNEPLHATWDPAYSWTSYSGVYDALRLLSGGGTGYEYWYYGQAGSAPTLIEQAPGAVYRYLPLDIYSSGVLVDDYELVWQPYSQRWVLRATGGAYTTVATGGPTTAPPWQGPWTGATVALKSTKWEATGLRISGREPPPPPLPATGVDYAWVGVPHTYSLLGDFTLVLDFTADETAGKTDSPDTTPITLAYLDLGNSLLWIGCNTYLTAGFSVEWVGAGTLTQVSSTPLEMALDLRYRLVFAADRDGLGSLWVNGQLVYTGDVSGFGAAAGADPAEFQIRLCQASPDFRGDPLANDYLWRGSFGGVVHEVGLLDGYAVTAADVKDNLALAAPYGFRGAPQAVTERT